MTGLIYVVIIALWAAVLIPIWLRRHDQISEVRSTARFRSAMSTLGRQQRMPSRTNAAGRRATILAILTLLLASTLILGVIGATPLGIAFAVAGLLLAYVVGAVLTAPQRNKVRAPAQVMVETRIEEVEVTEAAPSRSDRARRRSRMASLADDEEFVKWNAWDDDNAWEAIPQTLPTYVNAPRASSVLRPIDHAHGGDWSGSAMVRAAQAARRPADVDEVADHRSATAEIPVVQRPAANE